MIVGFWRLVTSLKPARRAHCNPKSVNLFFDVNIEEEVIGKSRPIRGTDQFLLLVHKAVRISGPLIERVSKRKIVDARQFERQRAPRHHSVRRIPTKWPALLHAEEGIIRRRVENCMVEAAWRISRNKTGAMDGKRVNHCIQSLSKAVFQSSLVIVQAAHFRIRG